MNYSGAEIIIKMLERKGIEVISGIPGSANLPLYKALHDSKIRHVLARHEQGAGFIAQGMARSTGKPAVCFATSGPGTTNLITAIADAKMDSVPVIAITGQVASSSIGTDAFQEIDTYGLTIPITKHNFLVRSTADLLKIIPEAFYIAESGRPGPVVIDVPKDVQTGFCNVESWPEFKSPVRDTEIDDSVIAQIAETITTAQKPLLFVGAGIIESGSEKLLFQLAAKNSIPVASTLRGLGCFPPDNPLFVGMIGMHGTRYANQLMEEADVVIALGVRFDDRATGKVNEFCKNAGIIHVDIDKSEINKIKSANLSVNADIRKTLQLIIPEIPVNKRAGWLREVEAMKSGFPYLQIPEDGDHFHPVRIIKEVAAMVPGDSIITTDVGQHQMWVAQAYPFSVSRTFLTSGGLGTMGFGVPVAIGAALANPSRKVICFSGDGSLLMNLQELATIAEQKCNVTIILFNNGYLGLVRQQQQLFYDQKYIGTRFDSSPDFAGIAENFGIRAYDLQYSQNPEKELEEALSHDEPVFINVPINYKENVFPMVPPGAANKIMIDA